MYVNISMLESIIRLQKCRGIAGRQFIIQKVYIGLKKYQIYMQYFSQ